MSDAFKQFIARCTSRGGAKNESRQIIEAIREVRRQLEGIQSCFAMETDEDLLDAAIYQRESLEARHRYLLRQARDKHCEALVPPIMTEERERLIQ